MWAVSKWINAAIISAEIPIGRRKNDAKKISAMISNTPTINQKFESKIQ